MKKKTNLLNNIILGAALNVTKVNANTACTFHIYQPEMPSTAKKLRKF